MKGKNSKYDSGCPEALNSKCVKWNGPAIPCLEICHDDVLTDVVYSIGMRVCELAEELDLSTLDLHCIIDLCDSCPTDKSLKSILQLMLENQCALKELIDDIITAINSGGSGGAVVLTLDMKCLEIFDPFGNPIDQDVNQTLQSIINEVCTHRSQIAALQAKDIDLQTQINNIGTGGGGSTYVPPTVNVPVDCINSPTPTLPADLAVQPLLNAFCDLKTVLGPNADLSTSVGRQCANLNTIYGLTPNWISAPATIADTINNQWIVICDLLKRVTTIETTCCAPNCDDIHIGFSAVYIPADNTFEITFDSANGTEIPVGFTDCGSVMTLTDHLGHSKVFGITIVQGDTITVSASGLNLTDLITVSIKTCFEHVTGLKCNDCFSGVISADSACAFCKLCAVGGTAGTDFVEISYQLNGEGVVYNKTLTTNECLYFEDKLGIPVIVSLWYSSSDISLETDAEHPCTNIVIPTPTPDSCWFFALPLTSHIDWFLNSIVYVVPGVTTNIQFDLSGNPTGIPQMNWTKFYDIHNLGGVAVTGPVAIGGSAGTTNTIKPALPTNILSISSVLYATMCPGDIGYDFRIGGEPAGSDTIHIAQINPNSELGYTFFPQNGKYGFVLTLKAQPATNIPMLVFQDPVTGHDVLVQGTLTVDCACVT